MESIVQTYQTKRESGKIFFHSLMSWSICHAQPSLSHLKEGCNDAREKSSWYATCFSTALASVIHCDSHSLPSPKEIRHLGKLTWTLPGLPSYCRDDTEPILILFKSRDLIVLRRLSPCAVHHRMKSTPVLRDVAKSNSCQCCRQYENHVLVRFPRSC